MLKKSSLFFWASSHFWRINCEGSVLTTLMSRIQNIHIFFMNYYNFCVILHKYIYKLLRYILSRYTHNPQFIYIYRYILACTVYSLRCIHFIQWSVCVKISSIFIFYSLSKPTEDEKKKNPWKNHRHTRIVTEISRHTISFFFLVFMTQINCVK